jgi:serine/threonine protein kinase
LLQHLNWHGAISEIWQGVIHRDVKPGNFLFSRKMKMGYLIDFNLALVSGAFECYFDLSQHVSLKKVCQTIEFVDEV